MKSIKRKVTRFVDKNTKSNAKKERKSNSLLIILFDISFSKCNERILCACPREKKVPEQEFEFLVDQRLNILDLLTIRQQKVSNVLSKETKKIICAINDKSLTLSDGNENHTNKDPSETSRSNQIRQSLLNFIQNVIRYQISNIAAASLTSSLLYLSMNQMFPL